MGQKVYKVHKKEAKINLVDFIAHRLNVSKKEAKRQLDARRVFVNRKRVWMAKHSLAGGDIVEVISEKPEEAAEKPITVLFEDAAYLVVDKPPGVLSVGKNSVEERLKQEFQEENLAAVHRLDRDTSGCLMLAKNKHAFEEAVALFRAKEILKSYRAIVCERPRATTAKIKKPLEGRTAVTQYRILDSNGEASHISVNLETGRTHQIRKHCAGIGHPVVGDKDYGGNRANAHTVQVPRQMLHAKKLRFKHPQEGDIKTVEAPLPKDFAKCLQMFGLK